jgi:hypothetical protein
MLNKLINDLFNKALSEFKKDDNQKKIKETVIFPFLSYTLDYSTKVIYPYFMTLIIIFIIFTILTLYTLIHMNYKIYSIDKYIHSLVQKINTINQIQSNRLPTFPSLPTARSI